MNNNNNHDDDNDDDDDEGKMAFTIVAGFFWFFYRAMIDLLQISRVHASSYSISNLVSSVYWHKNKHFLTFNLFAVITIVYI